MGMRVIDTFSPQVPQPIDDRMIVANADELESLRKSTLAYPFMLVTVRADSTVYQLNSDKSKFIKWGVQYAEDSVSGTTTADGFLRLSNKSHILAADPVTRSVQVCSFNPDNCTCTLTTETRVFLAQVVRYDSDWQLLFRTVDGAPLSNYELTTKIYYIK